MLARFYFKAYLFIFHIECLFTFSIFLFSNNDIIKWIDKFYLNNIIYYIQIYIYIYICGRFKNKPLRVFRSYIYENRCSNIKNIVGTLPSTVTVGLEKKNTIYTNIILYE